MSDKEVKCWKRFKKNGGSYITCQETYGGGSDTVRVYQDGRERGSNYAITKKQQAQLRVKERVKKKVEGNEVSIDNSVVLEEKSPAQKKQEEREFLEQTNPRDLTGEDAVEYFARLTDFQDDFERDKFLEGRRRDREREEIRQRALRDPIGEETRRLERKIGIGRNSPEEWAKHKAKMKEILEL
jgi:hypothetical protein